MDNLVKTIGNILENENIGSNECDETKCENIETLIDLHGWENVQDVLLHILSEKGRKTNEYEVIAEVFWGAVLDKRNICSNKLIALLYKRLPNDEKSNENNLVWSIVCKLKNVDYLSDYDPLKDQEIKKYFVEE